MCFLDQKSLKKMLKLRKAVSHPAHIPRIIPFHVSTAKSNSSEVNGSLYRQARDSYTHSSAPELCRGAQSCEEAWLIKPPARAAKVQPIPRCTPAYLKRSRISASRKLPVPATRARNTMPAKASANMNRSLPPRANRRIDHGTRSERNDAWHIGGHSARH